MLWYHYYFTKLFSNYIKIISLNFSTCIICQIRNFPFNLHIWSLWSGISMYSKEIMIIISAILLKTLLKNYTLPVGIIRWKKMSLENFLQYYGAFAIYIIQNNWCYFRYLVFSMFSHSTLRHFWHFVFRHSVIRAVICCSVLQSFRHSIFRHHTTLSLSTFNTKS
jgi:hypothetical protein